MLWKWVNDVWRCIRLRDYLVERSPSSAAQSLLQNSNFGGPQEEASTTICENCEASVFAIEKLESIPATWTSMGYSNCSKYVQVHVEDFVIQMLQRPLQLLHSELLVFTWIECCCFRCLVMWTVKERTVWSSQNIWLNELADNESYFNFLTSQPGAHQQSFLLHQITQILISLIQIFEFFESLVFLYHHIHSAVPHHSLSIPRLADACRLTQ